MSDHHANLIAICLGVILRTLQEVEPDPKKRRRIARNMGGVLLTESNRQPRETDDG